MSIAELQETRKALPVTDGVSLSELIRPKQPGGRDAFHRYAEAYQPILTEAGGKVWMSVRAEMPIVSEQFWDHLTLTHFPSLDAFTEMCGGRALLDQGVEEQTHRHIREVQRHPVAPPRRARRRIGD